MVIVFMANNSSTSSLPSAGWRPSGTDRGSVDIIWDCMLTIVLCCWVSTYPNVPSLNDKRRHRFVDKFNMACIGLVGPDLLLGIAMGQFAEARRSVKLFAQIPNMLDGRQWTLTHGFFADMGGFHLTSPDYPNGFPVTSAQMYYLVKHGHVAFPKLTKSEIKDMSKADTLAKVIVVWQVLWFCVTELQRARQGLPMTTLELTALSFSFLMVATSAFWFFKPTISRPFMISTKGGKTIEEIRATARRTTHQDLTEQWYRTPLYFLSGPKFFPDKHFTYYQDMCYKTMKWSPLGRQMKTGLWDRIPNDLWYPLSDKYLYSIGGLLQLGFSLSFLASWNFFFPTETESILWRSITVYHCSFSLVLGSYYALGEWDWNRISSGAKGLQTSPAAHHGCSAGDDNDAESAGEKAISIHRPGWFARVHEVHGAIARSTRRFRRISTDGDPNVEVGHGVWALLAGILVYIICRSYIYVADFVSMRSQPEGIYVTVNRFIFV